MFLYGFVNYSGFEKVIERFNIRKDNPEFEPGFSTSPETSLRMALISQPRSSIKDICSNKCKQQFEQ